MWRVLVYSCVSLCFAFAVEASTTTALQPWKAAEAVLDTLPGSFQLQTIDEDTLEVFCGRQLQLGLRIDNRLYQAHVGKENEWQRLDRPELSAASLRHAGAMAETEMQISPCLLPDVTLSGPLEIEWASSSRVHLRIPPEIETISDVVRMVIEDGAHVKLHGFVTLKLKNSVALHGVTAEYWDDVYGRRRDDRKSILGLMQMSAALRQDVRKSEIPMALWAHPSPQGIAISQLSHHPVHVVQTSPGVISIFPNKVSSFDRHQMASPKCWPFSEASASDVLPFENLLRQILNLHGPEMHSKRPSLTLSTAVSQAVVLLRLQMEVRAKMGLSETLEARVLIHDDQYLPLSAEPIESHEYITTTSPYDLMNVTADPDLPLYDIYL